MKKLLLFATILISSFAKAQQFCDPNGNLVIFSNYDGGILNIDVDVNIPNLKIGVVTYEAIQINLSGTYVGNVTDVFYAGYNGTNDNCNSGITNTSINGFTGNDSISIYPPVTLSNTYGNPNIVCAYSCDNNTSQGGCNTVDQVEAYFLSYFSGSTLRFHKVQYNCWQGTQSISAGGNCCGSITSLTAQAVYAPQTCNGACDGSVTASAVGGDGNYSYQWSGGPATATWSGLCAGTYTVTVTDGNSATDTQSVTIPEPPMLGSTLAQTACMSYTFNSQTYTASGTYYDTLTSTGGCDSIITLNLIIGTGVNLNTSLTAGTLTSAQAGASYQWINCAGNTPISGATAQSYTPVASGNYAVIVSYQGCSDTSACTYVVPTGVEAVPVSTEFNVYPNPAHNVVYVESAVTNAVYNITDQAGRVVATGVLRGNKTRISLESLPAGFYLMSISNNQPVKLIKQ